jgi:hypothetical protein
MSIIKDMVKDGKRVRFVCYRAQTLYYTTECGFEFPVPIEDIGDATFLAEDRHCSSCVTSASISTH